MEISAYTQRTEVGELVVNQLVGYEPAYQDTGQETDNRQEYLTCHEIKDIEQRLFEEIQGTACGP